ncbi:YeeE/YedE family protein [Asaia prunellae]|uniref:YeeE/YedE family protein n=1 Tax=Asaia prunellae TaxID=610245 RepID=UPI000ABD1D29|nr:YeeE/YedE thiosulfate transporter family protein [Asaia prunellae]
MVAPLLWRGISGHWPPLTIREPWFVVVPAGVLVGFGSQMACGCTSGHGVMGLARLSPRSLVAVGCFMTAAIATAICAHHMAGWWTRP